MNFKTLTPKLLDMVSEAHEGKCVLPEFQRSFVWEYTNVVDFLSSILQGLYIGSLLSLECDKDTAPFAYRPIEGVDMTSQSCLPTRMLLDGQQRITTLHYVFYAPEELCLKDTSYPYKFYLKMDNLEDDDLKTRAIWGERRKDSKKWDEIEFQYENRIIPFTTLRSPENWNNWLNDYEVWLMKKDQNLLVEFKTTKRKVWSQKIDNLLYKTLPIIELDEIDPQNSEQIAEVCAIFEKINSSGVRLSIFELLTARLYKYGINLRNLWELSVENSAILKEYSEGDTGQYGIFILRIICLIRGLEANRKSIISLKPENFERDWKIAETYLDKALRRVNSTTEGGFGGFVEFWIPYPPMLVTLAALLWYIDENRLDHKAYKLIKKWYWGNVFNERYQSGIETKTTYDFRSIVEHLKDESKVIPVFNEFDQDILNNPSFTLFGESRTNAVYKGVMCLLALNGAKDFRLQDDISLHTLDDHHIFPKAYLEETRPELKDTQKNVILNRTLIRDGTNRKIGKRAPKDYLLDEVIIEQSTKSEILERHFITKEAQYALENDDYDNFLRLRNEALINRIRELLTI